MMGLALNWVAIALSLTAGSPGVDGDQLAELKMAAGKLRQISTDKPIASPQIAYHLKVVEMEGLDWRTTWFEKLTPVARQGSATIWTASKHVARPIIEGAARVVASPPRVTASGHTAAHISTRTTRNLVSQVSWNGEAPSPITEAVREGLAATVVGRRLDQGFLVQIVVDDTELRRVHEIRLAPGEGAKAGGAGRPKTLSDLETAEHVLRVPEFASREIAGEWLIPNDGAILVSLGIYTASGPGGKAVVRERLMVFEADDAEVMRTAFREPGSGPRPLASPSSPPPSAPAPAPAPAPAAVPAPAPPSPTHSIPIPTIPSRSLPQGIHADGSPADLPPLPEDEVTSEVDDSAEPHGTPQVRPKGEAKPSPDAPKSDPKRKTIDSRSTQAGYGAGSPAVPSRAQWSPVKLHSFPASLDRWIESVRSGASKPGGSDCDESMCTAECDDE